MQQSGPIDHPPVAAGALADIATLPELWRWRCLRSPDTQAYRHFDSRRGEWTSLSWREIDAVVDRWRQALAADGFGPGERAAILMPNGVAHLAMDQAALSLGLVPVPMHAVDNADSIAYILADCGARLLLVDSDERWNEIAAVGQALPDLKRIICAELRASPGMAGDSRLKALDAWLDAAGDTMPRDNTVPVAPHDLAAIVYTSGTTGRPKGVMLSHDNVVSNLKAIHQRLAARQDDVFLSFLPLSHTFERTAGYYYPIAIGACVAYARSVKQLAEDLVEVRPTILISVPRIYERIFSLVMHHRALANPIERALLDLTIAIGNRRFDAQHGGAQLGTFDRLAWPLLKRVVADKVLARFGGRLQVAVSGGAPIAEPVVRLFLALGLEVLQGYGMTETSPVVSVNTPDDNDPRTVGRALPGIEVRIGDNDELMVRGPNVMLGYWHRPEETARIKQPDGWLHSGDQARIDHGRITITGRIKDILVTSTGEKIAPADLETAILTDPLFEQAIVIGENRPFLTAIVVLNPKGWAEQQARLAAHSQRGTEAEAASLLRHIARAVKAYPSYATPKAVHWTLEPWTVQAGLITPTLKNKRPAIERAFAKEIEAIYARRPVAAAQPPARVAAKAEARTIRSIRPSQQADPRLALHRAIDQSAVQAAAAGDCYRYHWRCILARKRPRAAALATQACGHLTSTPEQAHAMKQTRTTINRSPRRPATMAEVAARAGVSTMTVSRALKRDGAVSEETRRRILAAVEELGYVLDLSAGALSSKRTGFVAVLVPSINNSNFADTARGITEVIEDQGLQVLLGATDYDIEKEEHLVQTMLTRRPDGIIVTDGRHTPRARRMLQAAGIPVVEIWDLPAEPIDHVVGFSNAEASRALVRRLYQKGYRKIGFIGGASRRDSRGADRRLGYLRAIEELGLPVGRTIAFGDPPISMEQGGQAIVHLIEQWPDVDAAVCVSDLSAFGAIMECHRRGWAVPGRIGIAGFGDFEVSRWAWPRITTVAVNCRTIGLEAGRILLGALDDVQRKRTPMPATLIVPFEVIEREST